MQAFYINYGNRPLEPIVIYVDHNQAIECKRTIIREWMDNFIRAFPNADHDTLERERIAYEQEMRIQDCTINLDLN